MPEVIINGEHQHVTEGSVLSALQNAGFVTLRRSLSGEPRSALCGMGICFECRVKVNGLPVRSCLTTVVEGQIIEPLEASYD